MDRRTALGLIVTAPAFAACRTESARAERLAEPTAALDPIRNVEPLDAMHWKTADPFLFCAHHDDAYPAGSSELGPKASLAGRNIGSDFSARDGYSMYHGDVVPGFPQHPHRGFETVTIVRRGLVDHADSLGAAARYGRGDVQWLTAGRGIVHAEMFPLLESSAPNPLELFQIWLNLPSTDKLVEPRFGMYWGKAIPRHAIVDGSGKSTEVTIIAGKFEAIAPLAPPPNSWAARSDSGVAIWTIKMPAGARFTLPTGPNGVNRTLYFFRGDSAKIGSRSVPAKSAIQLRSDVSTAIENAGSDAEFLLLQGRPIGEPVARHGPFVMNTQAEIQKAYTDYRNTGFGGWPWPKSGPVHDRGDRFARHIDGRLERPT